MLGHGHAGWRRRGIGADRLIAWGLPWSLLVLAGIIWAGPAAGAPALALFCVTSTFVSLAQPAVGMAFPAALAGRALSAYNLVIFLGVFALQWGIGLLVDGFEARAGRRWRPSAARSPCSWPSASLPTAGSCWGTGIIRPPAGLA